MYIFSEYFSEFIKFYKPKIESLDFLISYADFILVDNVISDIEIQDFTFLKRIFKIKEEDFKKYKKLEMNEILKKEFIRIYSDNFVNQREELLNLNLQSLFNLSYDDFEEIKKDEIIKSLIQGANPKDLDNIFLCCVEDNKLL